LNKLVGRRMYYLPSTILNGTEGATCLEVLELF
jgi:hypothetical protein